MRGGEEERRAIYRSPLDLEAPERRGVVRRDATYLPSIAHGRNEAITRARIHIYIGENERERERDGDKNREGIS